MFLLLYWSLTYYEQKFLDCISAHLFSFEVIGNKSNYFIILIIVPILIFIRVLLVFQHFYMNKKNKEKRKNLS